MAWFDSVCICCRCVFTERVYNKRIMCGVWHISSVKCNVMPEQQTSAEYGTRYAVSKTHTHTHPYTSGTFCIFHTLVRPMGHQSTLSHALLHNTRVFVNEIIFLLLCIAHNTYTELVNDPMENGICDESREAHKGRMKGPKSLFAWATQYTV